MVIGAGGLGCPVLQNLAAAGVGSLGIVDGDVVEETNLHRQLLYTLKDCGKGKAATAAEAVLLLNPHVNVTVFPEFLNKQNAFDIVGDYQIIVDCTDSIGVRYLINDVALAKNIPVVYASIYKFEGQVSVFNYKNGPTYRCLFPEPPLNAPNCNEAGVLGVLPGIIGLLMANEVLKICLDTGTVLSGKIQLFNGLTGEFSKIGIQKNHTLKLEAMQTNYEFSSLSLCTFDNVKIQELDSDAFNELIKTEAAFLDVREKWEQPRVKSKGLLEIPLDQLENRVKEIPKNKQVIVFCQSGGRSKIAIHLLTKHFGFNNLYNLKDGLKSCQLAL